MIDLSKPPEEQELPKKQTPGLFGTSYESMFVDEITNFIKQEKLSANMQEVGRLRDNSLRKSRQRWRGMPPDPSAFDRYLGKICGTQIDNLVPIIDIMFEHMCYMPPSLVSDIIRVLNKNEYEHVNRCHTCYHFRDNGCYLKGYKQAKNPQDFCSSHSSYAHGSDN